MKLIPWIVILLLTLLLIETSRAEALKDVHCNGYAVKNGERIYYKLSGKILKENKSSYIVHGYSPVVNKKVTHKISKNSCADTLMALEPEVKKIKKVIEIPPKVEKELIVEKEPEIDMNHLVDSYKKEAAIKIAKEEIKKIQEEKLVLKNKREPKEFKILSYRDYLAFLFEEKEDL